MAFLLFVLLAAITYGVYWWVVNPITTLLFMPLTAVVGGLSSKARTPGRVLLLLPLGFASHLLNFIVPAVIWGGALALECDGLIGHTKHPMLLIIFGAILAFSFVAPNGEGSLFAALPAGFFFLAAALGNLVNLSPETASSFLRFANMATAILMLAAVVLGFAVQTFILYHTARATPPSA